MKEIQVEKNLNYIHLISGGLDSTYSLMLLLKNIRKERSRGLKSFQSFLIMGSLLLVQSMVVQVKLSLKL